MRMRIWLMGSALFMVGVIASAARGEGGIDRARLSEMGLEGLEILSDEESAAVRGFGYSHSGAGAYGHSWAKVHTKGGSAGSENGYKAKGKKLAAGENLSFAKVEVKKSRGKKDGHGAKGNAGASSRGGKGPHGGGGYGGGHGKPGVKSIKAIAGGGSFAVVK